MSFDFSNNLMIAGLVDYMDLIMNMRYSSVDRTVSYRYSFEWLSYQGEEEGQIEKGIRRNFTIIRSLILLLRFDC